MDPSFCRGDYRYVFSVDIFLVVWNLSCESLILKPNLYEFYNFTIRHYCCANITFKHILGSERKFRTYIILKYILLSSVGMP